MKVSIEWTLGAAEIAAFYQIYLDAFAPLAELAAARHVLTAAEFAEEMTDTRIEKVLVRESDGRPVSLVTITADPSAVAWISPEYFQRRYPDAAGRGAVFYLGYILVDSDRRRSNALLMMRSEVSRRVADVNGVIGFDICGYNNAHGVGPFTRRLFANATVDELDTQTYYAADYSRPTRRTAQRPAASTQPSAIS